MLDWGIRELDRLFIRPTRMRIEESNRTQLVQNEGFKTISNQSLSLLGTGIHFDSVLDGCDLVCLRTKVLPKNGDECPNWKT